MKRWSTGLHAAVYRLTSGRLLGRMGGQPVLLLQTIGRRTGQRRLTPVQYLPGGKAFVVVASNAGAARPPAWYLNLRADRQARVHVGERTLDVRAREVVGHERETLWKRLTAANRYLDRVEDKAGRELPLLVLTPVAGATDPTADDRRRIVRAIRRPRRAAARRKADPLTEDIPELLAVCSEYGLVLRGTPAPTLPKCAWRPWCVRHQGELPGVPSRPAPKGAEKAGKGRRSTSSVKAGAWSRSTWPRTAAASARSA